MDLGRTRSVSILNNIFLFLDYLFRHYKCICQNRISGVMFSMLVWSTVDRGLEAQSNKTKEYNIGNSCFFAKHAELKE